MSIRMLRPFAALLLLGAVATGCGEAAATSGEAAATNREPATTNREPAAANEAAAPGDNVMTVHATPTCGCCRAWMDHMEENGFTIHAVYQNDLSAVRREHGVPARVTSCHMGVVDGYVVEGHVPADVLARLLRERPQVTGLAVPGMPAGSPGMEMPNGFVQPYDVVTFDATGATAVYEHRN